MTIARLMLVACVVLFLAFGFAYSAMGQSETATVSGLITDDTGAVVPGAEVKLQSVERGTVGSATTNNSGIYVFASVHPGQYQITVHKPGFKQVDLLGMIVNVQDHIEQNFRLQIGSVAESVTVNANDLKINTTDATVSTVVDRQFAENLPMNGRSFQTLIELTPGVVLTPSNLQDSGQFSVNGQRATSNYWMVDGVSANIGIGANTFQFPGNGLGGSLGSFSVMGGTNSLVSVDALQEFRIQTSTFAPEFGRTPGGQISIVTRAGTNAFHGTAFDYLRNDVLDANNWFNGFVRPRLAKSKERQNDFGGTLGGPIFKQRTFFFFSYEGLRLRLPQSTLSSVPDLSARQNAVSAMQPLLNAFPVPNGPDNIATGVAQFNASYSDPASLDAYSLRIDHKFNDKLTLFGRYNYSPSSLLQRGPSIYSLSTLSSNQITTQTATVGATWGISLTMNNDLRFNYSRTKASSDFHQDNFGGAVPLTSFSFPSPFDTLNAFFFLDIFSLQQGSFQVGQNQENLQRQVNIVDSLSVQKGSHSLKFGVDFRRLSPVFNPSAYAQDAFFGNVPNAQNGKLLFSVVGSTIGGTLLLRDLGTYAQDTWRIAKRFSLTYGLRWDLDFVPQTSDGPKFPAVTGFDVNNLSNVALAPAGTLPYKTTYGNFAPRLGAAYQLTQSQDWQTVLRGGLGVFYDLPTSEIGNSVAAGYPFAGIAFHFGGTFPLTSAQAAPPAIVPPTVSNMGFLAAFDPQLQLPYTLEWNVALEQALGKQQTISASYIGATGRRLLQTLIVNPSSNQVGLQLVTNVGSSDYNALQVQFQRRMLRGFQALASYTWSHSIDTGSAGSSFVAPNLLIPSAIAANRAPSDFDIRHAFSAGLTYDVPAPKVNAFTNAILRGWSIENIILARSAPPVDITDVRFNQLGNGFHADVRPDVVAGQPRYLHGAQCASVMQALGELAPGQGCPGGLAFNPNAFTSPPADPNTGRPLRQGTTPRNFLRGFGATQWDFAIHRDFPIRESTKLQFRAEMFNVLNHPNFGPPSGAFNGGSFGLSTQTLGKSLNNGNLGGGAFNPLYQIGGPRSIQCALKLMF